MTDDDATELLRKLLLNLMCKNCGERFKDHVSRKCAFGPGEWLADWETHKTNRELEDVIGIVLSDPMFLPEPK
jgi:hypothetical protein